MKIVDHTGKTFGRLLVIGMLDVKNGHKRWLCQCSCGGEAVATTNNLNSGNTSSCGCLQKDMASKAKRIHGSPKEDGYGVWCDMRNRCSNTSNKNYKNYGGRGIKVCREWDESYDQFIIDMGKRPSPKHSIDRIDVNGDYTPDNCRWATAEMQANNRRTNRHITIDEVTKTLAEWCKESPISKSTIYTRLRKGVEPKQAVFNEIVGVSA